ncbi:hypothetical protein [Sphingomonas sp. Leaf257]|uniref:hypothetical protein n=1 Tax=Sphingomonas sp. Leaf257 TaxID=1736309 RepID=UPI000A75E944|nr:hypothetical protein [Sphingomonas sp. Leaf257]
MLPLSRFGVDRFSIRDQWPALRRAFEAAHAEGFDLIADPDASYRHDGELMLDGVSLEGGGCNFVALSDGPQVLRCIGSGWRVANLRLLGAARTRTSANEGNGIMIGDGDARSANGFILENVTVEAVGAGRGVAAAGMMFSNASNGRIIRPIVRHSMADGIHVTNGSHDLVFDRSLCEYTGDDGFAVVSYRAQGRLCHTITVNDGVSRASAARGCSVVGGRDVVYRRFTAEGSSAAGAYFYGEDAYDTFGAYRCHLIDPIVRQCATGSRQAPGFSNAAIILGGRDGSDMVDGLRIPRGASDCVVINPVVEGAGAACTAGISTHQYAIRPRITGGRLSNLISLNGSLRANGVEIGGCDVTISDIHMNNIAGLAIVVLKTASGTCLVDRPDVIGSLKQPGAINSFVYADPAPALQRMTVRSGRFAKGPSKFAIDLLPANRLHLIGNKIL